MKRHGLFITFWAFVCGFVWMSAGVNRADASYETGWRSADYLQARLISAQSALGESGQVHGAIEIRLSEGWHAYWRMPGEGGLPPRFGWDGSENLAAVDMQWPVPNRFQTLDMYSFGYKNTLLLPFTAKIERMDVALNLRLTADIMVCNEICVPQRVALALDIPQGRAENTMDTARIDKALKNMPYGENRPNLYIENVVIGPTALVVTVFAQRGYDDADLFVESGDLYITALPVIEPDEKDPRKALIRIAAPPDIENLFNDIGQGAITLTFTDGVEAIERHFDFSE